MLEHEPQKPGASTPPQAREAQTDSAGAGSPRQRHAADSARVTAEEFAAAVNALEQRKAEEAARLAGTVEIGPTIHELQIDALPEEILREVEAQRARKIAKARTADEKARAAAEATERLTAAAIEAKKGLAAASVLAQSHLQDFVEDYRHKRAARPVKFVERSSVQQRGRGRPRMLGGWVFAGVMFVFTWTLVAGRLPFGSTFNHHFGKGGPFISASALPDGHTAWVTTDTARTLLMDGGTIESAPNVPISTTRMDNGWEIINHGGKLYLHGYVIARDARPAIGNIVALKLFNDNNSGDLDYADESAVTVPMAGAHFADQMQTANWSDINLTNVTVDPRFHDMTDADGPLDH